MDDWEKREDALKNVRKIFGDVGKKA